MSSKDKSRFRGLAGALTLVLGFAGTAWGQITINAPALPGGEATAPYPAQQFTATDGDATATCCTWTSSGSLDGLTLDPSTGVLSGTPAAAGPFPFTVTATDSNSGTATSGTLTLTVSAGPGISPASLPAGEQGVSYAPTLSGTGGTPGYSFSLTGALPSGVSFDNNGGAFSGMPGPGTAGSYPITVQVTDSVGGNSTQGYTIVIVPPPSITTASLPSGEVGVAYPATSLAATGGTGPGTYTFSIASGSVPAGMTFSNGTIGGTPTAPASGNITFQVTDANLQSGLAALALNVTPSPSITTASTLPNGEATAPYSQTLAASGGTGSGYSWVVTGGLLPAGLSLSTGGAITGTPTTPGPANFTAKVTDSAGGSASQAFSLNVVGGPSITTTSLPSDEVTVPYSQTLAASGGAGSGYTWAVSAGSLPAGLSLNSVSGKIAGTPTTAGLANFTVQVIDSAGGKGTQNLSIDIVAGPTITSNPTLPQGEVGAAYSQTLIAAGGHVPPASWAVVGGFLPAGLSLNAAGVLSGTPQAAALGTSSFTVQAADNAGGTGTLAMSLTIVAGPAITTAPTLPNGTVGAAYTTVTLAASDGTQPFVWSITRGSLPPGLSLDANAGTITGTPTAATNGASNFTVQVMDAKGVAATKAFSITIAAGLTITTAPGLPNGTIGLAYTVPVVAAGGTPPYTWSVSKGSLPAGLTLNSTTGAIGGTPSSSGSFQFTVQVTDNASVSATKQFTLQVAQALAINTIPTLPSGAVGTPYSLTLSAVGGTAPYTFTVASGSLPGGLSLNPGGLISGTPASSGTFTFTVQVRDRDSVTATQQFNLTVVSGLTITTSQQLPPGAVNSPYSQTLNASGGTAPYTWTLSQGALPRGLSFSAGVISGTPIVTGAFTFSVQVADQVGAISSKQFTLTIAAGLTITSGAALPQGTIGVAYPALTLAEVGGSFPYTWSVTSGSLPTGLLLSSNGIITGTPAKAGTFNFTLQVKDSSGATATQAFTLSVVPPTVAQVNVAGVPPTSSAGSQIPFTVSLNSPYPLDITGEITMSFQPDAIAPAVDPAMQFSSGGTTAGFTIPANSTTAIPIALQTGTVSGTITLAFTLAAGGVDLPSFQSTIKIPRSVPTIQSVKLVRTSAGLEIHIVGFSPSRDLTEADLTFTAAPGATLQTTTVTENLASIATAWYQSTASAQYGSQLMLVLPFTASQGSVDAVGSVSVVLKNAEGSSPAASGTF